MNDKIIKMYQSGHTVMEIVRDLEIDSVSVAECLLNDDNLFDTHIEKLKARCHNLSSKGYSENAISKILLLPIISIKKLLADEI